MKSAKLFCCVSSRFGQLTPGRGNGFVFVAASCNLTHKNIEINLHLNYLSHPGGVATMGPHLVLLNDVRKLSGPDEAVMRSDEEETVAAVQ